MSTLPDPITPEPQASALVHIEQPAPRPTRTTRATQWLGYHFGELGLTVVFGVLAVIFSWWFLLGAGLVALLWTVHEYRVRRRPDGGERS